MKIAFTTTGNTLDAPLENRFGRTSVLLVYDLDTEGFEVIDNRRAAGATQGAGIKTAELVVQSGADGLITGQCGPKAHRVLAKAGIRVFSSNAATVIAALAAFRAGTLETVAPAGDGAL
jgi:predicted Fe-Mo cluster-binding NifX family protein